ncbi:hypothetical protein [Kribbella sindirgiensis]|uniref:Uncharacterized protein n=1 Tax=Kribbella sindirgiensis TaxID=1124744 RepID=A0A4R0IPM1_9ACTN|nr:hypothetical protein [Kribbella sindirgiensis]TCC34907.1 hypothetical protein E0H50_13520 [Kribbella sindirgiensis]
MTAISLQTARNRSLVAREFPFRTCVVCGFPIAHDDQGGSDLQPLHSGTCSERQSLPQVSEETQ